MAEQETKKRIGQLKNIKITDFSTCVPKFDQDNNFSYIRNWHCPKKDCSYRRKNNLITSEDYLQNQIVLPKHLFECFKLPNRLNLESLYGRVVICLLHFSKRDIELYREGNFEASSAQLKMNKSKRCSGLELDERKKALPKLAAFNQPLVRYSYIILIFNIYPALLGKANYYVILKLLTNFS